VPEAADIPGPPAGPVQGGSKAPGGRRLLERCRFPDPDNGPVALAVSGGPDSMALMVLAHLAGLGGRVIHVDHGLRRESGGEARTVASAAAAFGFAFEARTVRIEAGPDLEARARRARYQVLPPGVLVGHTMDDQAETILLNLIRGTGMDGLAGMRPGPGRPDVVRPLIALRRADTVEVCREARLTPLADPSNFDRRFRRNRIRHEVIPLLNAVADRDVVPILARQAEVVADDVAFLDDLAAEIDPRDSRGLRKAPVQLARRALRGWLRSGDEGGEQHPPSRAEISRVLEVAAGTHQACELSGGRRVQRHQGRLDVVARTGPPAASEARGQG